MAAAPEIDQALAGLELAAGSKAPVKPTEEGELLQGRSSPNSMHLAHCNLDPKTAPVACRAGKEEGAGPSSSMRSSAAASTSAAKQDGDAGGPLPIVLNEMRRADVSEYKGKTYVNIREYYQVHIAAICKQNTECL